MPGVPLARNSGAPFGEDSGGPAGLVGGDRRCHLRWPIPAAEELQSDGRFERCRVQAAVRAWQTPILCRASRAEGAQEGVAQRKRPLAPSGRHCRPSGRGAGSHTTAPFYRVDNVGFIWGFGLGGLLGGSRILLTPEDGGLRASSRNVTRNAIVLCCSDSSPFQSGTGFGTRERRRLDRARERGYLDARCRNSLKVIEAFGLWCWRLKVPMVWLERQTPRSKYGRVHLELFTTPNRLTASGQAAIRTLCNGLTVKGEPRVSPHNSCCDRVPLSRVEELAKAAFRAATRTGNYEPDNRGAGQQTGTESWRTASA